jgi:heme/copper-type cytochrome/quinol oxidase subunit 3
LLFINLLFFWVKRILLEGISGFHNFFVIDGLKFGFFLFLFSELIFFFRIFWFYFDVILVARIDLGLYNVPLGLLKINPFGLPFLNSLLLLRRAVVLTWSHYVFLLRGFSLFSLFFTFFLGFLFFVIQCFEYIGSFYGFSDSVFGRIFFLSTGFHGFHVLLGLLFLFFNFLRKIFKRINFFHHLGFEFSILY